MSKATDIRRNWNAVCRYIMETADCCAKCRLRARFPFHFPGLVEYECECRLSVIVVEIEWEIFNSRDNGSKMVANLSIRTDKRCTLFVSPNRRFFTVIDIIQFKFGSACSISIFCIWIRQLPLLPAYNYLSFDTWGFIRHSGIWIDCWLIQASRSTLFPAQLLTIRHCFITIEYFGLNLDIFHLISLSFYELKWYIICITFTISKLLSKYWSKILVFCCLLSLILYTHI